MDRKPVLDLQLFKGSTLNWGTAANLSVVNNNVVFKRSEQGHSARFDASTSYLSVADNDAIDFGVSDFSIEWYGSIEYNGANSFYLGKIPATQAFGWVVQIPSSNVLVIKLFYDSGTRLIQSNYAVIMSKDVKHYLFTINRTTNTVNFYINNVLQSATAVTATLLTTDSLSNSEPYYVGRMSFGGSFSLIDKLYLNRLYPFALTPQEITDRYASCLAPRLITKPQRGFSTRAASDLSRFKSSGLVFAMSGNLTNDRKAIDKSGSGVIPTVAGNVTNTLDGIALNTDGKVTLGNLGNVKSIQFRIKLKTTSEKILEKAANSGLIFTNAGTFTAADFANIYLNGAAGTTITAGAWYTVTLTSATNVAFSDATLGLNNATYGNFEITDLRFWSNQLTLQQAKDFQNSFAKTKYAIFDFQSDAVLTAVPLGITKGTAVAAVAELSADVAGFPELKRGAHTYDCSTGGTIIIGGLNANLMVKSILYKVAAWSRITYPTITALCAADARFTFANGALTITMTAADKLGHIILQNGTEV